MGGSERAHGGLRVQLLHWTLLALLIAAGGARAELRFDVPVPLNRNALLDTGDDEDPRIASDGLGAAVVVWSSDETLGGTLGTDLDVLFAHTTDGGVTWSEPAPLANSDRADVEPQIATDGSGLWLAVWSSRSSLGGTIGNDDDVLVVRSSDAGATWSPPAALSPDAAADADADRVAQIAGAPNGTWVVVWRADLPAAAAADFEIRVSRSTDGGLVWSTPIVLSSELDSGKAAVPQIATDGQGAWVIVWHSGDDLGGTIGTDRDVLFARSSDDGASWSAPAALNGNAPIEPGKSDTVPQIATDGLGLWMVVWETRDTLGNTIGGDRDILLARSTDAGASWSFPVPVNNDAFVDVELDNEPELFTDGQGTWIATWIEGAFGTVRDIEWTRSIDGGLSWTDPTTTTVTDGPLSPQLAAVDPGTWLSVWDSIAAPQGNTGADRDLLVSPLSLVTNGGFETVEALSDGAGSELPTVPGDWNGDLASLVGAASGIEPLQGASMARFDATTGAGPSSSDEGGLWQILDLDDVAADRSAGRTLLRAQAHFNRVPGDATTDTEFGLSLRAYAGDPGSFPAQWQVSELAEASPASLFSDGDPGTWETVVAELELPSGADFAAVQVFAREDVLDDTLGSEFTGHFVDGVRVVLAEPALADLDGDGVADGLDNCPAVANGPLAGADDQADGDADGVGDACDLCLAVPDPAQIDSDLDGHGDVCDCDFDGDGFCTIGDFNLFLPDFLSGLPTLLGTDMDGDGFVTIGDFNLFLPGFLAGVPGP